MNHSKEFHQIVINYLAKRCSGGKEPIAYQRFAGDYMQRADFIAQLSEPCAQGLEIAKTRLRLWAATGKALSLTKASEFVLFRALRVAQRKYGVVTPTNKIAAVLSGPPWSEATVNEIVDVIFSAASESDLNKWVETRAQEAYDVWKQCYREHLGPDATY